MLFFRINHRKSIRFAACLLLFLPFCLLIFSSCDDSFQPIQKNNRYNFNISGYLDASADTQWVRVGTIRESIDEPPNPEGIKVTLHNLQTGETVAMNDSVFTSKNILNYWTTMDIEHEQTYRIIAENVEGKSSQVTVTTPRDLPEPFIVVSGPPDRANIYISMMVLNI